MNKQIILNAFRISIADNKELAKSIHKTNPSVENFEDNILALSSIDFADLLIDIEDRLNIEFAEEFMTLSKISIGELSERIESHV